MEAVRTCELKAALVPQCRAQKCCVVIGSSNNMLIIVILCLKYKYGNGTSILR
jgi:hypothetical protein